MLHSVRQCQGTKTLANLQTEALMFVYLCDYHPQQYEFVKVGFLEDVEERRELARKHSAVGVSLVEYKRHLEMTEILSL